MPLPPPAVQLAELSRFTAAPAGLGCSLGWPCEAANPSSPATHTVQVAHRDVFLVNWKSLLQLGLSGLSPVSSDRIILLCLLLIIFYLRSAFLSLPFPSSSLLTSRPDKFCSSFVPSVGTVTEIDIPGLAFWTSDCPRLKQGPKVLASVAYCF